MNKTSSLLAMLCLLLLGVIAALVISFDLIPALMGQGTQAAGAATGIQVDVMKPLDALAAIDRKIAQGLTFLVFVAGLLPFLITYLDSQKRRELAEFEEKAEERANAVRQDVMARLDGFETRWTAAETRASASIARVQAQIDQRDADTRQRIVDMERHLEVRINDELSAKLKELENDYAGEISRLIIELATKQTREQLAILAENDANAELALFAFIQNDLREVPPEQQLAKVFRFQQMLRRIASGIDSEVYHALNTLSDACASYSDSTSGYIRQHLVNARDKNLIRSRSNTQLLQDILMRFDARL